MKKIIYNILSVALIGSSMVSCVDLDTVPEGGTLTADQLQEVIDNNPSFAASSVAGMYSMMGERYLVYGTSYRADDFAIPAAFLSQDFNTGDMVGQNSGYNWFSVCNEMSDRSDNYANPYMRWAMFYTQIALANEVINSVDPETENETLISYLAQAKAIRAFDYLCLAPYFQFKYVGNEDELSVIISAETLEGDLSAGVARATQREMYAYILADLTEAIERFESIGVTRSTKGEVDLCVAYGLRARANLYMENWQDAADDATNAIAAAGLSPISVSDASVPRFCDIAESNWMWGIMTSEANYSGLATWPSWNCSFTSYGYTSAVGCYNAISKLLFDLIPTTDVRRGWWVDENYESPNLATLSWTDSAGNTYTGNDIAKGNYDAMAFYQYTNVKFGLKAGIGSSGHHSDYVLMRVEEMYLIQAEATAMAGNLTEGKAILENFVTTYRDPSYTVTANDASSFQDAVWFQRRVELWGEGFALADVMRLGKNIVRYTSSDEGNFPEAFRFNVSASDPWLLQRIPLSEINTNAAVVQNTGGTQPAAGDGAGLTDGVVN